jgi:hypothetical protein
MPRTELLRSIARKAKECPKFTHALERIDKLSNPATLNALLDVFQSDGMPMGSTRWAESVAARVQELGEKERTLFRLAEGEDKLASCLSAMKRTRENCRSVVHAARRNEITRWFQDQDAHERMLADQRRKQEQEEEDERTWPINRNREDDDT